ncbi:portal protein [Nitratifractor salsuginis]|uniref:Bacteriophage head to tail connecting protein n=1 Tax=Nitratifractor salsuginis (strain DSM 16511 / JCM 12458 / E9I37-1) TaxID=749222 RepID=E6WY54_NITSE|nr:hypothetical protein [Nitratifractor salsuginis]ADV46428.1 hypothetical protein Nitsa_1175 [Nitratifractor salsuginis DSM 16511]
MTKKELILSMIDEAKKGFDLYRDDFSILEAGYLNLLPEETVKSLRRRRKSHITPKIIKAKVRKVAISVMKTYFENEEFAKLTPQVPTPESIKDVQKLQRALDEWTTKRINLYTRFKPSVLDALIYGTPIMKIYWADGQLRIERVKLKNMYLDPNASNVFDIQYCVHRVTTTIGNLRQQFGRKFKWKNYIGDSEDGTSYLSSADLGDASRIEVRDVYRYQSGKWYVSTVLPGDAFVRLDEPLKDGLPFIIGSVEPQFVRLDESNAVEAYGGSFIEPMIPLQEEYTVTRNQQIDAIAESLSKRFLATKTSGLNEKDLLSNRTKISVSSLNEVKELQAPRIDPSIFGIDRLDSEMQEVSGITKYNQGLNDPHNLNQTATGVSILTEEGNAVIADIVRALNESFFEPAIRRMVRLIYKYGESPIFYGLDRTKDLRFYVTINAGVGAVNNELLLNNIAAAEGAALQNVKLAAELQDAERAKRYMDVLDELFKEKLKALKLRTLIPTLKGETDDERRDTGDGTDGGTGGAGASIPQGGAEVPDGAAQLGGVPGVPGEADGEVQPALP